jgi:hypothetical protein
MAGWLGEIVSFQLQAEQVRQMVAHGAILVRKADGSRPIEDEDGCRWSLGSGGRSMVTEAE